ncbi:MAG: hypothetical protein Q7S58_08365 [Candidatus Binatus sp.]|uniref:hypothetical protein n=1 Tax=Candidatus Binatus sp. TaxID=2811406 RepID=UPI00271F4FA8|nr:hypothetical protein [Candidatus Binatus sp.]MDO8432405.1 hypothetical protein [Candidatus Binatus sp.]
MNTEEKKLTPAESVSVALSYLQKQGHLLVRLGNELVDKDAPVTRAVLGFLMPAIADSCGSLSFLVPNRFRDAFVTGRTVYLTILNACFICALGPKSAERALRHASQKAYRDLDRELKLNDQKIVIRASSKPKADSDPRLKAAIDEFTWPKGREITQWTPESPVQQLETIGSKYGENVAATLGLSMMMLYRHASEIAHGTLFGVMWSVGVTSSRPRSISEPDVNRMREDHWSSSLEGLLFCLNASIATLFKIVSIEFPSCIDLKQESDALYQGLMVALGLRKKGKPGPSPSP